jgi:hypothetical protein
VLFLSENTPAVTLDLDKKCREVLTRLGEVSKLSMNTLSISNISATVASGAPALRSNHSHTMANNNSQPGKRGARNTLPMVESERIPNDNNPVSLMDVRNLFLEKYPEKQEASKRFINMVKQVEFL